MRNCKNLTYICYYKTGFIMKKKRFQYLILGILSPALMILPGKAQEKDSVINEEGYKLEIIKQVETTPVKDQASSGTCWSFSATSFIETELIRMGKGEYDLSEMFFVWHAYSEKAEKYVRMQGKMNFADGGEFHDVMNVVRDYGIVPEEIYNGKNIGEEKHIHMEMEAVLTAMVGAVIKNKNGKLTPVWHNAFNAVLDEYLGKIPEKFNYKNKEYTPKSFAEKLGINPDDYIEITSFTHHPFYKKFVLEVPDNWASESVYNVPLEDLSQIIDNALNNGYSVAWGGDVSEGGFSFKDGIAVVPEKKITQELRQEAFDNYSTEDDHGMHITGIAKDQKGDKYYLVKNSWGVERNNLKGYFYASEAFVLYKTTSIMLHKNAVPKNIAVKLGL